MSYTATQARVGLGSQLVLVGFPLASPPVADASIGEITDIVKSGAKADTISAYNMESPDGFDEFVSGKRDAGELSCTVNFIPGDTTQGAVEGLFNSGARRDWKVIVPPDPSNGEVSSPGYWAFKAIVSGYGDGTIGPDKIITQQFKLKISGKYTWTATP